MHSISGVIYLILAACLLPYVFTLIAKKSAGFRAKDNQNPRAFLEKSTGLASRANAAQQNSFWIAYLVFRVIYGICYLANWSTLRSIVWLLSLLCPITLLLLIIKIS